MSIETARAVDALTRQFLLDYPLDAARKIEELPLDDVVETLRRHDVHTLVPVWRFLLPEVAAALLRALPEEFGDRLLGELPPSRSVRVLSHLRERERSRRLSRLDPAIRADLETLLSYPPNTAGRLMDSKIRTFRPEMTAGHTLKQLRKNKMRTVRSLFLTDESHRLTGKVALVDVALAEPQATLGALGQTETAWVRPIDHLEELQRVFETHRILDLPVVDLDGVFLGAVVHDDLVKAAKAGATTDMQTMVGASKDERALSSPIFTVRKRMPWLQINLLTAFLAAAVVGIFEETIAQVTALAVLLPVVAGQSGNAGAQALAVTMRGLALREITARQWARVMRKEVIAGLLNGVSIAVTCGAGVYVWSRSLGLVFVIATSMVLAMISAGFAGAIIPVVLTRLGQDPATASSIILTTVTDVAGFFSFLGIATLLMRFL